MTILLVTLASIIFTFLLYLAVNYKRVDIGTYSHYSGYRYGIVYYNTKDVNKEWIFNFYIYALKITVWDEIRDLPF